MQTFTPKKKKWLEKNQRKTNMHFDNFFLPFTCCFRGFSEWQDLQRTGKTKPWYFFRLRMLSATPAKQPCQPYSRGVTEIRFPGADAPTIMLVKYKE